MARWRDRAYGRPSPLLEVIQRGALPWDPVDVRRHGSARTPRRRRFGGPASPAGERGPPPQAEPGSASPPGVWGIRARISWKS